MLIYVGNYSKIVIDIFNVFVSLYNVNLPYDKDLSPCNCDEIHYFQKVPIEFVYILDLEGSFLLPCTP